MKTIKDLKILSYFLILTIIYSISSAEELPAININDLPQVKKEINEIIKNIETKNFQALKNYITTNKKISWLNCGAADAEPFVYSGETMIKMLSQYSKDVQLYVNRNPVVGIVDEQKGLFTIVIKTEGWIDEYPFVDFSFEYSKPNNQLRWFHTCYDAEPPLEYSRAKHKFVREYYRKATLPRPGPRVFKDRHALGARINEIIKFGELDALSAYAIKKRIIFSECGQSVIVNEDLEGEKVVPVEQVINYLKKNMPGRGELKVMGHEDTYTAGWRGEYPYINFIISETKRGWGWNQVVYCKKPSRWETH